MLKKYLVLITLFFGCPYGLYGAFSQLDSMQIFRAIAGIDFSMPIGSLLQLKDSRNHIQFLAPKIKPMVDLDISSMLPPGQSIVAVGGIEGNVFVASNSVSGHGRIDCFFRGQRTRYQYDQSVLAACLCDNKTGLAVLLSDGSLDICSSVDVSSAKRLFIKLNTPLTKPLKWADSLQWFEDKKFFMCVADEKLFGWSLEEGCGDKLQDEYAPDLCALLDGTLIISEDDKLFRDYLDCGKRVELCSVANVQYHLACSAPGCFVFVAVACGFGSEACLRVFSMLDNSCVMSKKLQLPGSEYVTGLAFINSNREILLSFSNGRMAIFDCKSQEITHTFESGNQHIISHSCDNKIVFSDHTYVFTRNPQTGSVKRWKAGSGFNFAEQVLIFELQRRQGLFSRMPNMHDTWRQVFACLPESVGEELRRGFFCRGGCAIL